MLRKADYQVFLDRDAVASWLPPETMTGRGRETREKPEPGERRRDRRQGDSHHFTQEERVIKAAISSPRAP